MAASALQPSPSSHLSDDPDPETGRGHGDPNIELLDRHARAEMNSFGRIA